MRANHSQITYLLQRARAHRDRQDQLALWQCAYHAQQNNRSWLAALSSTRPPRNKAPSSRVTMASVHDERSAVHPINPVPYRCPIVIA